MTQPNDFQNRPLPPASVGKRLLLGAAIGLVLIYFFLLGAGEPAPEWPRLWWVRPLLVIPAAGALGGLIYSIMDPVRRQDGWRTALAHIASLLVFLLVLWLGTVLERAGTVRD